MIEPIPSNLDQQQYAHEKSSINTLHIKTLVPHIEGYGDNAQLTVSPSEQSIDIIDCRQPVDIQSLQPDVIGHEIVDSSVVVIDLDSTSALVSGEEVLSGGTPSPFDKGYKVTPQVIIAESENPNHPYRTNNRKMQNFLRTGQRENMDIVAAGSPMQRHVLGVIEGGDLNGQQAYADCRLVQGIVVGGKEGVILQALLVHGSEAKIQEFLKQLKDVDVPAKHSPPAWGPNGQAQW